MRETLELSQLLNSRSLKKSTDLKVLRVLTYLAGRAGLPGWVPGWLAGLIQEFYRFKEFLKPLKCVKLLN